MAQSEINAMTKAKIFNALAKTKVEIVIAADKSMRLALRSDSLKNIQYFHRIEGIPIFDSIMSKAIRLTQKNKADTVIERDLNISPEEEISWEIDWKKVKVESVFYSWNHRKFRVKIWKATYELSLKQKELLVEFISSPIGSLKLRGSKYQQFLQFKKLFPKEIISFLESKRKKNEKTSIPSKPKEASIVTISWGPNFYLASFHFQVRTKTWNGNLSKYIVEITEWSKNLKVWLTPKEYELFVTFSENMGQIISISWSKLATFNSLRKKIPGIFKNKRWEWYYIWTLVRNGIESGMDYDGDDTYFNDAWVIDMIDEALNTTPAYSVNNVERRHPAVKKRKKKMSDDEKHRPVTLKWLGEEFDIWNFTKK